MAKTEKLLELAQQHLEVGETTAAWLAGTYQSRTNGTTSDRTGVLLVTDRRVLLYAKRMGGFDIESFPFRTLTSFEQGKTPMGHTVTFFTSNNQVLVKWIVEADAVKRVTDLVTAAMHRVHAAPAAVSTNADETTPAVDPLDQIRRLAELRDEGLVTHAEFAAKKAELLARL